jgi:hypothetical protein
LLVGMCSYYKSVSNLLYQEGENERGGNGRGGNL